MSFYTDNSAMAPSHSEGSPGPGPVTSPCTSPPAASTSDTLAMIILEHTRPTPTLDLLAGGSVCLKGSYPQTSA